MHVDSSIWFSPKIDRKRLKELSKRSDLPGLIHFVIYFASLIFFGYLSYVFWGTWFFLLFFFLYSTIYTFAIANGHETVHRTAFKTRWINEMFCYISFFQLSSDISGRDAVTKVRGRLKDKEEEKRLKEERDAAFRKEMEAKYAKWNKG